MSAQKFNINHEVRVRLTQVGREIIAKKTAELKKVFPDFEWPNKEGADGWATFQMWELIQTFGGHINNGCRIPFETEIEILFKDGAN